MVVHRYDRMLMVLTMILIGIGLVMVFSASVASAEFSRGDGYFYLKRQLMFVGLALVVMIAAMNVHHDLLRRLARPAFGIAIFLLVVVLIPGLGASAKGASRWISLGPLRFQPSELIKLTWIIALAWILAKRQAELDSFKRAWVPPIAGMAVIGGLLMAQPDFGSTVICAGLMLLMVWAAGGRWLHVGGFVAIGAALVPMAILAQPYRVKRLLAFLSPEEDPQGVAYHINQALISFGSGRLTGLGLGGSKQKLLYLPEAHTDFIFSIIGEELGLVGAASIMVLFALFIWRGFHIARNASSAFGALLAFGITAEIGFQALTNMAVATAMMPTKGLTLPFISYGGSSVLTLGLAVGVLLNISRREPPPMWMHRLLPDRGEDEPGPNKSKKAASKKKAPKKKKAPTRRPRTAGGAA
jgi:cell division protein FtsW